jgi:hypothetical protein
MKSWEAARIGDLAKVADLIIVEAGKAGLPAQRQITSL